MNNTTTTTTNTSTPRKRIRLLSEVIKSQNEKKIDDFPPIITGTTVIIVR